MSNSVTNTNMSNMNTNRQNQQRQIIRLTRGKAYAWAMYYNKIEETHRAALNHYNTVNRVDELIPLPDHITTEWQQMLEELHKQIECPICFNIIEEGKLKITGCGHKFCENCFNQIDKCAICRKNIKKN